DRAELDPQALADAVYRDMLEVHRLIAARLPGLAGPPFLLIAAPGAVHLRGPLGNKDLRRGWAFAGGWCVDFIEPRKIDPPAPVPSAVPHPGQPRRPPEDDPVVHAPSLPGEPAGDDRRDHDRRDDPRLVHL